jgi:transcriptional regulator with XRE-family HTH domain
MKIYYTELMPLLGKWLETKMLQWELQQGGRRNLEDFATFLGLSRSYLSEILNGSKPQISRKAALKIAQRLGDFEIMDICGYSRPDPADLLADFPPELRDPLLSALSEARSELVKRGTEEASPADEEIIRQAFAKYGVQITFTKRL